MLNPTRMLVVLFALTLGGGCLGVAMGKVAPGSRQIIRAGGTWQNSASRPGYQEWVQGSDQGSKGPMGGLVAGRFGVGSIAIGDRRVQRDAGLFDLRLEIAYMFTRVGASLSGAWRIVGAHSDGTDISRTGFPLRATLSVVPVQPLLLRFTGFVEPGSTSVDDTGSTGLGKGAAIGLGLQVQFRAWHFVVGVDWEHEWIGDVATPTGPASYKSSAYLLDLVVVGW